jgi:uncharacterized protein
MKRLSGLCALVCAAIALPALAATFVQDGANMLSAGTVGSLNRVIGNFNTQTGKEIVVDTVPSLNGTSLADAAHQAYTQRNVNGVLIFIARDDRRDIIVPDAAGVEAGWFTRDTLDSIRSTMESQFKAEDYDGGVTSAVDGVLNIYRAHLSSSGRTQNGNGSVPATRTSSGRVTHISLVWWIVIIGIGFLILRSIMRAMSGPRYGPPGVPPGAVPPGGVPPQGYGYGQGGGFGGGGSFWSGLLGGLGGAWLGNEMFNRGGGAMTGQDANQTAVGGDSSGGWGGSGSAADAGGLQSDAGQADMGGASSGDWSGGGFGGGDFGGGGDSGGGGGDSGGGGW